MKEIDYRKAYFDREETIRYAIDILRNIIHEYREDGYIVDDLVKLKDFLIREA